jgi:Metal-dependent proteases with possible chaperone activity
VKSTIFTNFMGWNTYCPNSVGGDHERITTVVTILGIDTSCDETSAAVVRDEKLLSNTIVVRSVIHSVNTFSPTRF